MKIFEGKSPAERNKIIAAIVLGVLVLLVFGNFIFAPFSGKKTTINVKISPTPTATASTTNNPSVVTALPKQEEIDSIYLSSAVSMQSPPPASDAGRNIFAFYEPAIPTPFSPTPYVAPKTPTPIPPTPAPTPNVIISYISRQNAYAGDKGFKLEIGGDKFAPDMYVFFGGTQLPTTYLNPQQLSVEVPSNFIAGAGQRPIEVRSADGKLFSNQVLFSIQAPPQPQFQYLGIVSRKRGNNDTAYIQEQGKTVPTSVRLNDLISGRFRLVSISPSKLLVQDKELAFLPPYPIELVKGSGQGGATTTLNRLPQNQNFPPDGSTFNPNNPNGNPCVPGIPCNLKQYQPNQNLQNPNNPNNPNQTDKKDVDDVDDDGDN